MRYVCEKYMSLSFYVNGERLQFTDGYFETTDKKEQAVLNSLPDVKKIDKSEDEPSAS